MEATSGAYLVSFIAAGAIFPHTTNERRSTKIQAAFSRCCIVNSDSAARRAFHVVLKGLPSCCNKNIQAHQPQEKYIKRSTTKTKMTTTLLMHNNTIIRRIIFLLDMILVVFHLKPAAKRARIRTQQIDIRKLDGGRLIHNGLAFRQIFTVKSYDVGSDGSLFTEVWLNYFQECFFNHTRATGILAEGIGFTTEMRKRNLLWVFRNIHILVDDRPSCGDAIEVDTWICSSGRNGIQREWIARDLKTNKILVRAISHMVMISKVTRKLSRIEDAVRMEIKPFLMDASPISHLVKAKVQRFDIENADYVKSSLAPRWSDIDMNQPVNNAKYINWILEVVPHSILQTHELSQLSLEYKKECKKENLLESLSSVQGGKTDLSKETDAIIFHHMIRLENGSEVLVGRTIWKPKHPETFKMTDHVSANYA